MARYYLPKGLTYNLIDPTYPAASLTNLKNALLAGINAEVDWGQDQAAGPLTRWFEYSHGNVGAGKAWALTQTNALAPGKPSPFFEALDNAVQDGATLVRGSGDATSLAYVEGNIDPEWQEPARQMLVVLAGGDAVGVPIVFVIADVTDECPLSTTTPKETWETWGTVGGLFHLPEQIDGVWYRISTVGQSGEPLQASQWFAYAMGGGAVISMAAYQAIQAANQPSLP